MIALRNKRNSRKTQIALERLDLRIAPATMSMAATLAAEIKVETHQVQKLETSLATAQPGSKHEKTLIQRIGGEERMMGRQEARLAQIEARAAARAHPPVTVPASNFFVPTSAPMPVTSAPMAVNNFGSSVAMASTPALIAPTSSSNVAATATGSAGIRTNASTGSPTETSSPGSLPANVSQTLDVLYAAYVADPSGFPANIPTANGANLVVIQGTNVGIQVQDGNPANFGTLMTELQNDGLQVTASSAQYGLIDGLLPIAQLTTVASLTPSMTVAPEMAPSLK